MIYTSYFSKLKYAINPVSICGKAPEFYKGPEFKTLAPRYWFFKEYKDSNKTDADKQLYTERYKDIVLGHLDQFITLTELWSIYPRDPNRDIHDPIDITLLCYEKPGDFCHRNIVADWFRSSGYKVEELVCP